MNNSRGRVASTNPANLADGKSAARMLDPAGRTVVTGGARGLYTQNRVALATTTETTVLAAGGAGVFLDLTHITISSEATAEVRADFRDTTGGTVRFSVDCAPDGGGATVSFRHPWNQTSANANWTVQLSAATTGSVYIMMQALQRI